MCDLYLSLWDSRVFKEYPDIHLEIYQILKYQNSLFVWAWKQNQSPFRYTFDIQALQMNHCPLLQFSLSQKIILLLSSGLLQIQKIFVGAGRLLLLILDTSLSGTLVPSCEPATNDLRQRYIGNETVYLLHLWPNFRKPSMYAHFSNSILLDFCYLDRNRWMGFPSYSFSS